MLSRHLEHVEMDARILVPGEADVADLARRARFDQRRVRALGVEDPVRIVEANYFVVLHEVNAVGLQAPQRFVELSRRFLSGPAVDLRHQEDLVAVAVAECLPRSDLAGAAVVVPGVVHEVDPAVDRGPNDTETQLRAYGWETEVPASEPDSRYSFSGASKNAVL